MDDLTSKYKEKAEKLKKEKKFEEALKITDKIQEIQAGQRATDYWYKQGEYFSEVGEYEKALDCYNKDLTLHEKSYDVYFEKGKILLQLKNYSESLESFNKAEEIRNHRLLQHSTKANHLKNAHKFEKALLHKDEVLNEKPLDEEFWHYKGLVLLKLKRYNDAFVCFEKAVVVNQEPKCLYDLAKCLLFLGHKKDSLNTLSKAIHMDPSIKEKLKVDAEFTPLENNKQFRTIVGL